MPYAVPEFKRGQVNAAGRALVSEIPRAPINYPPISEEDRERWDTWSGWIDARERALVVVNNWRSSHSYPLNVFQGTLRHKAAGVDPRALISQRIKRLPAIELKLRLHPGMEFARMQDIGGCRAVLRSVAAVRRLVGLYEQSELRHTRRRVTDYITNPRDSGYRGIHLIYQYKKESGSPWDGLQIEMQLRSQLQHAWATAVETVGTFLRQALKSSVGEEPWLRFFALMGSAMALEERTMPIPNTPTDRKELIVELRKYVRDLEVVPRLQGYGVALQKVGDKNFKESKYFLLELDARERRLRTRGFKANELQRATEAYLDAEKANANQPGKDTVLVSVRSLSALRRAYPSYFLDTRRFVDAVQEVLKAGRSL
jgi:ppGpp synthetase/RelA/SpoT-type nucleotidyltranferase